MPIYRVVSHDAGKRQLREWRRNARRTFGLLFAVLAVCTTGLAVLDDKPTEILEKISKAEWNALNLVTTLGDFRELDERQMAFMMVTMVAFLGIGGFALSRLTGILSSNAVIAIRENRTMARELGRLDGHVIVIGFRYLGQLVTDRLRDGGRTVVVVERDEGVATQASDLGYLVVQGDAGADDSVFDRAGVDRAQALVVATDDPDRNIAITLMAHSRNPAIKIAVIGADRQRGALLRRAGASEVVIADDLIAGALVSRLDKTPDA